jgi:hypothetical protein
MQSDRSNMGLIQVLMDLKGVSLMLQASDQRLVQWRQDGAGNIDYWTVNLSDGSDLKKLVVGGLGHI